MKKLLVGLMLMSLGANSFANCLDLYNSNEVVKIANKKTKTKRGIEKTLKVAPLVAIPLGATIFGIATAGGLGIVYLTTGIFPAVIAQELGNETEYFQAKSLSSLEKAIVSVNWAHSNECTRIPRGLETLVGSMIDSAMEPELSKYLNDISEKPRKLRKELVKSWIENNKEYYLKNTIQDLKLKISLASATGELCEDGFPANLVKLKRIIKNYSSKPSVF